MTLKLIEHSDTFVEVESDDAEILLAGSEYISGGTYVLRRYPNGKTSQVCEGFRQTGPTIMRSRSQSVADAVREHHRRALVRMNMWRKP